MPPAGPRIVIIDASGRREISVNKPLVTIGRRSESDIPVTGVGVSRRHAEIAADTGEYRLRDLDSKFGTYVNGTKIAEHILRHGDRIRLGDSTETELTFLVGDDAPSHDRSAISAAGGIRHMAGLLEGLRALGSGRVVDDVLALVLDSAIQVTGAERGFIMLADEEGILEFKLGRSEDRVTLSGRTFETSRKIPEGVFATGITRIVDDLMESGMAPDHLGTVALGIRQVLCAPLRLVRYVERGDARPDDKVIGVLYLDSREPGALTSRAAQTALEGLSAEAAVAIENARLYRAALERAKLDEELKIATAIQQSLLPTSDRNGIFFSTAGSSVACRGIGGDFFDYVDIADHRFGFIVGDVAGKGAPAALLAAAALGMFGAEATYHSSCSPVVTRLNRGLCRRRIEGRFLTAFYGILDRDGSFVYANAGHNAPLLITASGVRRLAVGGTILGVFEDAVYDDETIMLAAGDVIVAFSDGVSEALNEAGEEYSDDRLLAAVASHRTSSPQQLLAALLADVGRFCGGSMPNDDVTMVVVRYDGYSKIRPAFSGPQED